MFVWRRGKRVQLLPHVREGKDKETNIRIGLHRGRAIDHIEQVQAVRSTPIVPVLDRGLERGPDLVPIPQVIRQPRVYW